MTHRDVFCPVAECGVGVVLVARGSFHDSRPRGADRPVGRPLAFDAAPHRECVEQDVPCEWAHFSRTHWLALEIMQEAESSRRVVSLAAALTLDRLLCTFMAFLIVASM